MGQIVLGTNFVLETCINCGVSFAFTRDFYDKRRDDHEMFFCPNGHQQYYSGESDKEKLRKQLEASEKKAEYLMSRANDNLERYLSEKRSKAVHKAHYTMLKKKIKKGQCPCCDKSFPDVAGHIQSVHPDYNKKMKIKKEKK